MTRDEAVEKLKATKMGAGSAGNWVDRLYALGILELDEPRAPEEEFCAKLTEMDDSFGLDANDVFFALKSTNLKVVRA